VSLEMGKEKADFKGKKDEETECQSRENWNSEEGRKESGEGQLLGRQEHGHALGGDE